MDEEARALELHRTELKEKLEDLRELIAPRECAHGWWDDCDQECKFNATWPTAKGYMLDHIVLVTSWIAMDADEWPALCIHTGPRQGPHVTTGLLHEALYPSND